ncbi:MAG TPA: LysM peptidoglycan-binding domain-containing M23 family metallopeptidase, partial [Myxococcota bacterium]|nr:LysM peptidoglycan-binding domain-containing M23 family metallopeptidase [Myxococcota bacterium]
LRRAAGYARMGGRVAMAGARGLLGLVLALGLALGCASTPDDADPSAGVTHVLQPGENLYRLSLYYGVSVEAIQRANQIDDVTQLRVGQHIWIPGARRDPASDSLASASPGGSGGSAALRGELDLIWPVRGRASSGFGRRNGRGHDGLDIPAKPGTPIVAAAAGRVIHSGTDLGDYGRVVIVKHEGNYSTVYAHNRRNRVEKGDFVEQGQLIGEVGSSGNASGPHLHFEVRRKRAPVDPMLFLP